LTVPPFTPAYCVPPLKYTSQLGPAPKLETLSIRSWVVSGSVRTFQSRRPAPCSTALTVAGLASGWSDFHRAAAPATAGVAIDVPEETL
jgi:hypothetical protein